jgi:hypothetical protein
MVPPPKPSGIKKSSSVVRQSYPIPGWRGQFAAPFAVFPQIFRLRNCNRQQGYKLDAIRSLYALQELGDTRKVKLSVHLRTCQRVRHLDTDLDFGPLFARDFDVENRELARVQRSLADGR